MRSDPAKDRSIPIVFFITTIVAYGLLLPQTGFYWDDWPFAWIARFLGPADFIPSFAKVRPFLGPIFFLTTSLIPPVPLYWQIFMLLLRFASGLLAWFIFNQVWPQHKRAALVASFLFLLFPGYSQHWVAFTHINQEWIAFIFYLLSFGFTARALRRPEKFKSNTWIAIFFLVLGVFPTEYFMGLEPLRFLFIWVIISEETRHFSQRLKKSLKIWAPYLLIWLVNAAWLVYFFFVLSYGSYDVEVVSGPVSLLSLGNALLEVIWKTGFYIWGQVLVLVSKTLSAPSSILTLLLIGISCALLIFYFKRLEKTDDPKSSYALSMLIIGIVGILLGRLPSFAAGLPLTLQSSNDRFMISMMIGGSLFITGLLELLIRNSRIKTFLFAGLIALGIGQQFYNANIFRRDWLKQQEFYSQLAWRIPAMQPGTLLITNELPVDYETDLSFTAPINWMYAPDYTRSNMPYALIYTEKRLGGSLPSLASGEKVNVYLRTTNFEGSTSNAIVVYMPRNGCLRVLGSEWNDENTYAGQSPFLVKAIPLSNPGRIDLQAEDTPRLPFLSTSKPDWCYYYAKAELARQKKDWGQVNNLYRQASVLGYRARDPLELLVFVEAEAMTGNMETAKELSDQAFKSDQRTRKGLCQVWKRVQLVTPSGNENQSQIQRILSKLQCNG